MGSLIWVWGFRFAAFGRRSSAIIVWVQNAANLFWNKKLLLLDFRMQQICFETGNYYCLTSECSKSVLKREIIIVWLQNAANLFWNKKLLLFDFRMQQICFETINYYCLSSEFSKLKSVLKQEIIIVRLQNAANLFWNKKFLLFDFRMQQICFETRNYHCLTSECSKSVLK